MGKKEILPFTTTWMELVGIMLSEIIQRKTNTEWHHFYVKSKKSKLIKTMSRMVVTRVWGGIGEMLFQGTNLQPVDEYVQEIHGTAYWS